MLIMGIVVWSDDAEPIESWRCPRCRKICLCPKHKKQTLLRLAQKDPPPPVSHSEVTSDNGKIVWPPAVILQSQDKWLGMGAQELLEYFDSFEDVKALSAFGLEEGHMGMSVLIFDASAVGYLEAERLGKHFDHQGLGRNAWNYHPNHMDSDGKPRFYGYLATEQDLEVLNLHSPEFEIRVVSYPSPLINLDVRNIEEENKILRQRTQMYHDHNEKELKLFQDFIGEKKKIRVNLQQGECKTVDAVPQSNHSGKSHGGTCKGRKCSLGSLKPISLCVWRWTKTSQSLKQLAEMKSKEMEAKEKFNSKLDQLAKRIMQSLKGRDNKLAT